jgi:hypothetical protein
MLFRAERGMNRAHLAVLAFALHVAPQVCRAEEWTSSERITLNSDGSGTYEIDVRLPLEELGATGLAVLNLSEETGQSLLDGLLPQALSHVEGVSAWRGARASRKDRMAVLVATGLFRDISKLRVVDDNGDPGTTFEFRKRDDRLEVKWKHPSLGSRFLRKARRALADPRPTEIPLSGEIVDIVETVEGRRTLVVAGTALQATWERRAEVYVARSTAKAHALARADALVKLVDRLVRREDREKTVDAAIGELEAELARFRKECLPDLEASWRPKAKDEAPAQFQKDLAAAVEEYDASDLKSAIDEAVAGRRPTPDEADSGSTPLPFNPWRDAKTGDWAAAQITLKFEGEGAPDGQGPIPTIWQIRRADEKKVEIGAETGLAKAKDAEALTIPYQRDRAPALQRLLGFDDRVISGLRIVDAREKVGGREFECKKATFQIIDGRGRKGDFVVWFSPEVKGIGLLKQVMTGDGPKKGTSMTLEITLVGMGNGDRIDWGERPKIAKKPSEPEDE